MCACVHARTRVCVHTREVQLSGGRRKLRRRFLIDDVLLRGRRYSGPRGSNGKTSSSVVHRSRPAIAEKQLAAACKLRRESTVAPR